MVTDTVECHSTAWAWQDSRNLIELFVFHAFRVAQFPGKFHNCTNNASKYYVNNHNLFTEISCIMYSVSSTCHILRNVCNVSMCNKDDEE